MDRSLTRNTSGSLGRLTTMKSTGLNLRVATRLGVVATVWACVVFAPAAVQADCAHYVGSKSDSARMLAALDQTVFAEAIGAGAQRPRNDGRPAACPGGMCSQGPTLPLAPTPEPIALRQWGISGPQGILDGPKAVAAAFGEEAGHPVRVCLDIFHPPRLQVSL
jgi:hypothetical protein